MGFTAYRTWVAAETVDEDHMNEQVRDNGNYLKDEADKHTTCTMRDGTTVAYASPSGTRVKDTVYQNTSGKIRLVAVAAAGAADADTLQLLVGVANPPTISMGNIVATAADRGGTTTFFVPPSYYYKANEAVATMTIASWTEWDIL